MANMLERLVFIDETSLKTNLVKTTGWAPVGKRLVDHAPFGHWHTQTFIAGLAHDGLIAPWVLDGAMNRDSFETYITRELAPALRLNWSKWRVKKVGALNLFPPQVWMTFGICPWPWSTLLVNPLPSVHNF